MKIQHCQNIGHEIASNGYTDFDGSMSHFHFIDGYSLSSI